MNNVRIPYNLKGVRLEIGNPEHIAAVIKVELENGYDRRIGAEVPDKTYEVTLSKTSTVTGTIIVKAKSKELGRRIAIRDSDNADWDDYNCEIAEENVEYIEEIRE